MLYVINPNDNNNIVSIFSLDYKNKIRLSLYFICQCCGDDKCVFVNKSKDGKQAHFRHSKYGNKSCYLRCSFKEFNNDYCYNLLSCVNDLLAKKYIMDTDELLIRNIENPLLIRHNILKNATIEKYENNTNSKIIWLLDFNTRYTDTFHINRSYEIFIKFDTKNDIPSFNHCKSKVYLDTGYDIIIDIDLSHYNNNGYEITFIHHTDFFEKYNDIFYRTPERTEWEKMKQINERILKMKMQKYDKISNSIYDRIRDENYDTYDNLLSHCINENNITYKHYVEYLDNLKKLDDMYLLKKRENEYRKEQVMKIKEELRNIKGEHINVEIISSLTSKDEKECNDIDLKNTYKYNDLVGKYWNGYNWISL